MSLVSVGSNPSVIEKKKKHHHKNIDICKKVTCRTVALSRFLFGVGRCGNTPRWVVCVTALSRVKDEETPQSVPGEARMVLKDYSDKEAVQSRE